MGKFITKLVLFVLMLLLIVYAIAGYDNADRNTNSDHNVLKVTHMSAFDSLNILFVGNSFCYSSIYNPLFDSLGIRTFNLGVASAGPRFYSVLLDDYLAVAKKKPDTVMLLVTPMTFSGKADNWIDYPIHRYLKMPLSNLEAVVRYGTFGNYLPMLLNSTRKGLNNLLSRPVVNQGEVDKIFRYKGLYIDSTVTNDSIESGSRHLYNSFKNDHFDKKGAQLLRDIANTLKRKGIVVIFFETPTHHLKNYFSPAYLDEYDSFLNEISRSYPLIRAHEMDSRFFRNIDHTNTQGAYVYTYYLISKLYQTPVALKTEAN